MPGRRNHEKGKGSKPRGASSLFKPEYVEQARNYCELGAIDQQVAKYLGVSKKTLYSWQQANPELREAMEDGKVVADGNVTKALYCRAIGAQHKATKVFFDKDSGKAVAHQYTEELPPDPTSCIFWLKNRQKELWRDTRQNEVTGAEGKPLVDLSAFSTEQLQTAIAALIAAGASGGNATAIG